MSGMAMEALKWLRQAHDLEQRAGDTKTRASTFLNLCAVYSLLGRHVDALQSATQALKLLKAVQDSAVDVSKGHGVLEKVDPASMLAIAYHNIGVEQEHLERYAEAYQSFTKALDVAEMQCGPQTPLVSKIRTALANATNAAKSENSKAVGSTRLDLSANGNEKLDDELRSRQQSGTTQNGMENDADCTTSMSDTASIVAPLLQSRQTEGISSLRLERKQEDPNLPKNELMRMENSHRPKNETVAEIASADITRSEHAVKNSGETVLPPCSGPGLGSRASDEEVRIAAVSVAGPPRGFSEIDSSLPRSLKEEANIKCWGKPFERPSCLDSETSSKGGSAGRRRADTVDKDGGKAVSMGVGAPAANVQRESSSASELSLESRDCSHSSRERAKRPLSAARLPLEEDGGGSSSSNRGRHSRKTARPRTAGRERMREGDREELMALTDPSSSDAGPYASIASVHIRLVRVLIRNFVNVF